MKRIVLKKQKIKIFNSVIKEKSLKYSDNMEEMQFQDDSKADLGAKLSIQAQILQKEKKIGELQKNETFILEKEIQLEKGIGQLVKYKSELEKNVLSKKQRLDQMEQMGGDLTLKFKKIDHQSVISSQKK